MQLEDGRFLMAAERYDALLKVCAFACTVDCVLNMDHLYIVFSFYYYFLFFT